MRPKRVYKSKTGKYYYLRKGKRVYIRRKKGAPKLSQKQVVKVSIKNIIGDTSRRVKRRRKRQKLGYTKKIIEDQTPAKTGLPVYLFEPKKVIPSLTERVSTKAKQESTSSYDTLLKSIEELRKMITIPDSETKTKVPATTVGDEEKKPKKPKNKYTFKSTIKFFINKIKKSKIYKDEKGEEENLSADLIEELIEDENLQEVVIKKLLDENGIKLFDNPNKYYLLIQKLKEYEPDTIYSIVTLFFNEEYGGEVLPEEEKKEIERDDQQMPASESEIEGSGNGDGEDGLYNGEIEKINKKVFKTPIPVIAKNELDTLDQYVKPNMDKFGFIINTDPVPQPENSNGHWRAVYINNCDDYQSIEYFDPLVSTPEKSLIAKLKQITKKMNPEQYFLFKINNLKTQPDESDNCGYHCILFLEKRFHNVPWSEATYYNDYMKKIQPEHSNKGEGEVLKAKKKYKTYL